MRRLTKFVKWLCNLLSDYRTDCNMPFGHQDVLVGELLATNGQLNKAEKTIQRVRELAESYLKENIVSPYPDMARQILTALDGEQE